MPKNLITLSERFGGNYAGAGRRNFIISDPKRLKSLQACAASMGARATTLQEKTVAGKHLTLITVVYAS